MNPPCPHCGGYLGKEPYHVLYCWMCGRRFQEEEMSAAKGERKTKDVPMMKWMR